MSENLDKAKENLLRHGYTYCMQSNDNQIASKERGVAPLLKLFDSGFYGTAYSAADKVVGLGAAYLYIALNVKEVFAVTISESAKLTLESHGITCAYDNLVPNIINRSGTGICPIESSLTQGLSTTEAISKIRTKLASLI